MKTNNSCLGNLEKELEKRRNPEKAAILKRFFKTGKGEYGEGDIFLGINVPEQRKLAKLFQNLERKEILLLLKSKIHEKRLIALLILILKFEKGGKKEKQNIFTLYLASTKYINNWDLVDCSAPNIAGKWLLERPEKERTKILKSLACSESLWERRIAVISTLEFIRQGSFDETLRLCEILIDDRHNLIHKASGWMLRELGKRDQALLEQFLEQHKKRMPRTMLGYAIERLEEKKRKRFLESSRPK